MIKFAGQVPVYLIADALDECPKTHPIPSSRGKVLQLLKEVVELQHSNLRLCVISRLESDIRAVLEPLAFARISLHSEIGHRLDIVDYIRRIVHSDRRIRGWREKDKQLVIKTLSERADGM
jgi:hypothetical protein